LLADHCCCMQRRAGRARAGAYVYHATAGAGREWSGRRSAYAGSSGGACCRPSCRSATRGGETAPEPTACAERVRYAAAMGASRIARARLRSGGVRGTSRRRRRKSASTVYGCDALPPQQRGGARGAGCGLCFFCGLAWSCRVACFFCRCLFSAGDGGQRPPVRGVCCRACTLLLATEVRIWATPEPREAGERDPRAYRPEADDERRDPNGEVSSGTVFRRGRGAKAPGCGVLCRVPSSIRHGCSWRAACAPAFRTTPASGRDVADGANRGGHNLGFCRVASGLRCLSWVFPVRS
jgi:hypothetical protein